MRRKERLFPGRYRLDGMDRVSTVREFDDVITARNCGYGNAVNYYRLASAARVAQAISVPALIITAKDDPFVPMAQFTAPEVAGNAHIRLLATEHGGHLRDLFPIGAGKERYWAEGAGGGVLR